MLPRLFHRLLQLLLILFFFLVQLVLLVLAAIACKLFNIEYDVIFNVFLLDLLELPLEAGASFSVALGEGVPAEGLDDLGEEAAGGALLLLLPDDVRDRVVEDREVAALNSTATLEFSACMGVLPLGRGSMWLLVSFTNLILCVFYRLKVVFIQKAGDSPPAHRCLQGVIPLAIDHYALTEV